MQFLNPALLWGSAIVSIPIIIHLLNRRRYRIEEWAAMEFLLQAYKKERRRIRFENLILLLLRMLVLALLVLAVARPFLSGSGLLTHLGGRGGSEQIIIVDDTFSMNQAYGDTSAFELARRRARAIVRAIARDNPDDAITIVRLSKPEAPLVRGAFAEEQGNADKFDGAIESLKVTHAGVRLSASLAALGRALLAESPDRERVIYLLSDFRRRDWSESFAGVESAALPGFKENFKWVLVDVGSPDPTNAGVLSVRTRPARVVRGIPFDFVVRVKNFGSRPADVNVRVKIGKNFLPSRTVKGLGPGEEGVATVPCGLSGIGAHPVAASIADDPLPDDNIHHGAARVVASLRALLVHGRATVVEEEKDVYPLASALDPRGEEESGVKTTVVSGGEFENLREDLSGYDVVFLANVPVVSSAAARRLDDYVAEGGALIVFCGPDVNQRLYNRNLYRYEERREFEVEAPSGISLQERDGLRKSAMESFLLSLGVLPAPLGQLNRWPRRIEAGEEGIHPQVVETSHPGLARTAPLLRFVNVRAAYSLAEPLLEMRIRWQTSGPTGTKTTIEKVRVPSPVRILARYTDPKGTAAIVEKRHGKGKVLLVTTTADGTWNDWFRNPSFLAVAHDVVGVMVGGSGADDLRPGQPYTVRVDPERFQRTVTLIPPSGHGGRSGRISRVAAGIKGADGLWARFDDTRALGTYSVTLTAVKTGEPSQRLFSVNVDPSEGELVKMSERQIRAMLGRLARSRNVTFHGFKYVVERPSGADEDETGRDLGERNEIWRGLVIVMLAFMVVESWLAWWIGRK